MYYRIMLSFQSNIPHEYCCKKAIQSDRPSSKLDRDASNLLSTEYQARIVTLPSFTNKLIVHLYWIPSQNSDTWSFTNKMDTPLTTLAKVKTLTVWKGRTSSTILSFSEATLQGFNNYLAPILNPKSQRLWTQKLVATNRLRRKIVMRCS